MDFKGTAYLIVQNWQERKPNGFMQSEWQELISSIATAIAEAVAAERDACVEKLDALVDKRQETFERFERIGAGAAEVNSAEGALNAADEAASAIRARGNSIASGLSQPRTESE